MTIKTRDAKDSSHVKKRISIFEKNRYKMRYILLFAFAFLSTLGFAQQTTHNWDFDGTNRKYIQYVPSVYDGTEPVPLLLVLHGLGDNMNNFSNVGFHQVADTANIIVVTPEALIDQLFTQATAWNP